MARNAAHVAAYLDIEMFPGERVSHGTGLAGLTHGDAIRSGGGTLGRGERNVDGGKRRPGFTSPMRWQHEAAVWLM